jgi:hypothetical protein
MFSRSTLEEHSATQATRRLTIALKILLYAAIATAPLYLVGESFDLSHVWRVTLTNGGTALAAFVLLVLVRRGHIRIVASVAVWGLFALVASLAATNGEPIHVNVVNFSLVLVLANFLLLRDGAILATIACVLAMTAIAYNQALVASPGNAHEIFVETIVQFLPQFILIAFLLRLMPRSE